ncbi:PolC-type DNA polymerase III [Bradyrhizobium sp. JYMT SZCCT0428]|uniref:3'-5' exonuclease n=1 Tax=Bradyrhizobium sp. JYMT SZCCT0428 TaxID=2807673 RepID=UPI00201166AE|nr:exonuclease domain-containing protein [Bradyrhizobium sp. JYMT SZCCT0428]
MNPQWSIPARIAQITNITNEMVRYAPIFSEVADSFMQFMGDGIFVAHNVDFD